MPPRGTIVDGDAAADPFKDIIDRRYLESVLDPSDEPKARTAIVGVSMCDLPAETFARLRETYSRTLRVVSTLTNIAGESYEDKIDIEPQQVCDWMRLDKNLELSTAAARARSYSNAIRELLDSEGVDEVIVLTQCIRLSPATRGIVETALKELDKKDRRRVTVYDSDLVAGSLGMMMLEALRLTKTGMTARPLLGHLDALKLGTGQLGAAPDLYYAIKGGRVKFPKPVIKIIQLLGLRLALWFGHHKRPRQDPKPFVKKKGKDAIRKVREAVRAMVATHVPSTANVGFVVQHTGRADDVKEFVDFLRETYFRPSGTGPILPRASRGRVGFATYFKRTAIAVQRCKDEPRRSSQVPGRALRAVVLHFDVHDAPHGARLLLPVVDGLS